MAQSTALLIVPPRDPTGADSDAIEATVPLLTQNSEDLRLAERVERALHATDYRPLRRITVRVHARIVFLGGRVSNYYLKQIAQTAALAVPGIHQIHNDLEVG